MTQRHTSPGREKGCRTQGRPAGLPAAPQEAERPQRPLWNPPRLSTITTGAPTFHTHTRVYTLARAASHGHHHHLSRPALHPQPAAPAWPLSRTPLPQPPPHPRAGRTWLKLLSQPVAFQKLIRINRQREAEKVAPASSATASETPKEPGLQGLEASPLPLRGSERLDQGSSQGFSGAGKGRKGA